ncbi:MAG: nucleotidyl transferase AbiEii/AbiGii toxin family protein [Verrucomicrobia bacterium]|nr:nucleotidyl transferase AbiEii/AbiGii toxin family protein [Verrucomicrobiota bacterium]
MSLFDQLVNEALRSRTELAPLRPVVEKELLHHDILREMAGAGLLAGLTFIGGTCLRACYGSTRLSEDLDFTGGSHFERGDLAALGRVLVDRLEARYGLPVKVSEPVKTGGNVSTWKLVIETRPGHRHLPAQRIHLDICAIPSHDPRPMMLRNSYGVDLGTAGLILQAQSREEILADKIIALAFREGRMKNRDLWDIGWLVQQGVEFDAGLLSIKVSDHRRGVTEFSDNLLERLARMKTEPAIRADFVGELRRFLPAHVMRDTLGKEDYWTFLLFVLENQITKALNAPGVRPA